MATVTIARSDVHKARSGISPTAARLLRWWTCVEKMRLNVTDWLIYSYVWHWRMWAPDVILEKLTPRITPQGLSMVYEAVNSYSVFPKIELYMTPQVIAYRIFPLVYCFCIDLLLKCDVRVTDVLIFYLFIYFWLNCFLYVTFLSLRV